MFSYVAIWNFVLPLAVQVPNNCIPPVHLITEPYCFFLNGLLEAISFIFINAVQVAAVDAND